MIDLHALKDELARFGSDNDAHQPERGRRMLNITPDTGQLLAVLVRATAARRVLEIGTSNGYSTLWLAEAAAAIGGQVTTVELAADKVALAQATLARSGLAASVEVVHGDGGAWLTQAASASIDLVFLDSARGEYVRWWPALRRVLRGGGLLVVDNALSHADELAPFTALLADDPAVTCSVVPVGKGELLAVCGAA
ncbi:O-methyltransferase [Xanthomonas arboricola]|uniref:O-methyltransferase n=1 Tax=Xanthomonas arboricola TaxID=56448 RepID=UPI00118CF146|nr:class I SAM-dependent methyltransferase [Xanthomonas arboricola]QDS14414.1 methyltransferase domain-containing protein [Xanthomonas arboricola]